MERKTLEGKHIVTIGAGTGQRVLLEALRMRCERVASITAVVGVTDNGGHSGELRKKHHIPQVGDGRQCLVGLAQNAERAAEFDARNGNGENAGNLRLLTYVQQEGTITKAFAAAGKELDCCGRVLPMTDANVEIVAELEDGRRVTGEWEIKEREPMTDIRHMELSEPVPPAPGVLEAIERADLLLIAPGTVHTGLVTVLLPEGVRDAIRHARAPIVQIVNMMTHPGFSDGWNAERHVAELEPYLGRPVDAALVNTGAIPPDVLAHYHHYHAEAVSLIQKEMAVAETHFVGADLVPDRFLDSGQRPGPFKKATHLLRHDAEKLLSTIENVTQELHAHHR
jgi:uncharacterized cofD-like protein